MYKDHLLFNIRREYALIQQLIPMIEEKDLDFRPHENVRSTYELMQYLGTIGGLIFRWMLQNDMTPEVRLEYKAAREAITLANFAETMERELKIVEERLASISEEELYQRQVEMPTKDKLPLGSAIINGPIKWLATYRMDLFMYLKINGKTTIGTKEAWMILTE